MISREEAKTVIHDKLKRPYSFGDINNLVDKIYDSIGSCGECKYYEEDQCSATKDMVYRNPLFFCADFERKESCGT